jgi:hypothetical protein
VRDIGILPRKMKALFQGTYSLVNPTVQRTDRKGKSRIKKELL